jgi:hypothetical protein
MASSAWSSLFIMLAVAFGLNCGNWLADKVPTVCGSLIGIGSAMGVVVSDRVLGIARWRKTKTMACEPTTEASLIGSSAISSNEWLRLHAKINRPLLEPLSARGTAKFFAQILHERLGL